MTQPLMLFVRYYDPEMSRKGRSTMTTYDFHGATLTENLSRECGHTRLREADSGCELCDIDWLLETDNVSPDRDEGPGAARRRMLEMRTEVVTTLKKRRAS